VCSTANKFQLASKIYSIFEPHTDLIKRGKVQTPVEFGHKVFLAESARGLITQYEVLDGNPVDEQHVVISLERHKQTFGDVPELYSSDRGFFSESNVTSCEQQGVKWCASHSGAAPKRPSAKPMRRAGSSRAANAFAPASRDASRCCSAVAV